MVQKNFELYIYKLDLNKRQNDINEDFDFYYYGKDLSKDESIKKVIENYKNPYLSDLSNIEILENLIKDINDVVDELNKD